MPVSMLTRGCFGMEIDAPSEKGNLEGVSTARWWNQQNVPYFSR